MIKKVYDSLFCYIFLRKKSLSLGFLAEKSWKSSLIWCPGDIFQIQLLWGTYDVISLEFRKISIKGARSGVTPFKFHRHCFSNNFLPKNGILKFFRTLFCQFEILCVLWIGVESSKKNLNRARWWKSPVDFLLVWWRSQPTDFFDGFPSNWKKLIGLFWFFWIFSAKFRGFYLKLTVS